MLSIVDDARCGVLSIAARDFTCDKLADMPDTGRQEKVLELVSAASIQISDHAGPIFARCGVRAFQHRWLRCPAPGGCRKCRGGLLSDHR